jgi:predicted CXXCH cytochrome family protein
MRFVPWLLTTVFVAMPAAAAIPAESEECLGCHTDQTQAFDLPSGEKLPLGLDQEKFARSVHGENLKCTDCHADKKADHATGSLPFKNRREVTKAYYEQCKGCHYANYTKTLDGVHYAVLAKGNDKAALCVDCHGAHDISRPGQPRTRISLMCQRCHPKEAGIYANSVHGKVSDTNPDVPICTDCHRAHDTTDPRDGALARRTPELCGRCHGDEKLMRRYRLSTHVVSTYLADFHGMSSSLQRSEKQDGQRLAAVCTDCHGVHDIQKTDDPNSSVMSANLQKTCARCHQGASASFPKAWLSHYEPSLDKAPLVWLVQLFYRLMIPFMVGGLVLQILLHLWRVVVNR